jgi:hypothetical protein
VDGSRGRPGREMSGAVPPPPLTAAAERLRGKPGRPRKPARMQAQKTSAPFAAPEKLAVAEGSSASVRGVPSIVPVVPVLPRLLDLHGAAAYLGLRERKLRELAGTGILPRVRIPMAMGGEVRKLLFDRLDLDRLIGAWKDRVD